MGRSIVIVFLLLLCFVFNINAYKPDVTFSLDCEEDNMTLHFTVNEDDDTNFIHNRNLTVELIDCDAADTPRYNASMITKNHYDEYADYGESASAYYVNITTDYDDCGTNVYDITAAKEIHLNNTAVLKVTELLRDGQTQRVTYYTYNVSCVLDKNTSVSADDSYNVDYTTKNVTDEFEQNGTFTLDFKMEFFQTQSFVTPKVITANQMTININENLYVEIEESTTNTDFDFAVTDCVASTSSSFTPPITNEDKFFAGKCPLDPTFTSISSASDDFFRFKIQAFSFKDTPNDYVYLHCLIYICKAGGAACTQQCPPSGQTGPPSGQTGPPSGQTGPPSGQTGTGTGTGTFGQRKRRDAEDYVKEVVVSSPLLKYNTNIDCTEILCPTNSRCAPLQPARCICDDDYVFSRTENKCIQERILEIENIHINKEWNPNYTDPKHPDFLKLALKYEDVLYKAFMAADATREIEGVRVIGASPGSIILETKIIYGPENTPQEAYNAFVKSITSKALDATTVRRELELLTDRTPTVVTVQKKLVDIQKLTLIIIIVMLLLVMLMSVIIIFVIRRNKKRTTKLDIYGIDNGGIEATK